MEQINFAVSIDQVAQTTFYSNILWRRRQDALNRAIGAHLKMKPAKVFLGRDLNEQHNNVLRQQFGEAVAQYWEAVGRTETMGDSHDSSGEILLVLANKFEYMTTNKVKLDASKDTPATTAAYAKLKGLSLEQAAAELNSGYEQRKQEDTKKLEEKMQAVLADIENRTHEGVRKVVEIDAEGCEYEVARDDFESWMVPFGWIEKAYETQLNNALKDPWAERREGTIVMVEADFKALKGSRRSNEHTNRQIDEELLSADGMAAGSQAGK